MPATRQTFQGIYDNLTRKLQIETENMGHYSMDIICHAINACQHRLAIILARRGDEFIGTSATEDLVANQEIYSIGKGGDFDVQDYLHPLKQALIVMADGQEYPLIKINIQERYKYVNTAMTTGSPQTAGIGYYYFTTKASSTETSTMLPALGIVAVPSTGSIDGLKIYYVFKPRPISWSDGELTNGAQIPDLPENVIPFLETLTERYLLEHEQSEEKLRIMSTRMMEERSEATDAMDRQAEDEPKFVRWMSDPAVDY